MSHLIRQPIRDPIGFVTPSGRASAGNDRVMSQEIHHHARSEHISSSSHPADSHRTPPLDARGSRQLAAPSPLHMVQTASPIVTGKNHHYNQFLSAGPSNLTFPPPPSHQPPPAPVADPSTPSSTSFAPHTNSPEALEVSSSGEARATSFHRPRMPSLPEHETIADASLGTPVRPPKLVQLRNSSAPTLLTNPSDASPTPHSSSSAQPSIPKMRLSSMSHTLDDWPSVRKSSIDSALSSIFSGASQSRKSSQDSVECDMADIATLSTAAGSPEAAIQYLLRDKQSSAAQNAQLWRLVDKQRTMILGLNKDLERALSDKERYRKKWKELVARGGLPVQSSSDLSVPTLPASRRDRDGDVLEQASNKMHAQSDGTRRPPSTGDDAQSATGTADTVRTPHGPTPPASRESSTSDRREATRSEKSGSEVHSSLAQTGGRLNTAPLSPQDSESASEPQPLSPEEPSPASQQSEDPSIRRDARVIAPLEQAPLLPFVAISEPSPELEQRRGSGSTARKAPPAPLKLTPNKTAAARLENIKVNEQSGSDSDDMLESHEIPVVLQRGRRKTREEDDRAREVAIMKEQDHERQSRSQGKSKSKSKSVKSSSGKRSQGKAETTVPPPTAPPPPPPVDDSPTSDAPPNLLSPFHPPPPQMSSPRSVPGASSSAAPMGGILSTPRVVSPTPLSPGLPMSPRPTDRPPNSPRPRMPRDYQGMAGMASPALSPRPGTFGLPSSPRAPMQSLTFPPMTPSVLVPPTPSAMVPPPQPQHQPLASLDSTLSAADKEIEQNPQPPTSSHSQNKNSKSSSTSNNNPPRDHPSQQLNAENLSSVEVKVSSSRLKPSKASNDSARAKIWEPNAVMTLGVFSRTDGMELWKVEKDVNALSQLEQELKGLSELSASFPDRNLFSGHAPARVDARRAALDRYLDAVMRCSSVPKVAFAMCDFLRKNTLDPSRRESASSTEPSSSNNNNVSYLLGPEGRIKKEGYLTKRGKNFGGWKARFFSLDGPTLRYYESPGGPHLGTIRLKNARIGKQSGQGNEHSPARGDANDPDNEYRHAFLILEPKKKDSSNYVRHLLCAESDAERDEWVVALLHYVDDSDSEEESSPAATKPTPMPQKKKRSIDHGKKPSMTKDSPTSLQGDGLRAVSYEETVQAEPPVHLAPDGGQSEESLPSQVQRTHISGPTNGAKIQDAGAWGNKPQPVNLADRREQKKRSIFGFKGRSSSEPLVQDKSGASSQSSLHQGQHMNGNRPVRPVFGTPLAEAAEYAQPVGIDVYLPAVVYRCIEYLDAKDAASEEGIFRLSGSNVVIKALRQRFDTEGDVNFLLEEHHYDVHAVASLLKMYLRELPSSVLTRELHLDFLHVLELDTKAAKIEALSVLVRKLPRANQSLLRALSSFLITIVDNSDMNKMTVRNVGIVFSPTLNIPAPVLSMFLSDFNTVFGVRPEESMMIPSVEVVVAAPEMSPDDIRSPRRQLFQDLPTPAYNQPSFPRSPANPVFTSSALPVSPSPLAGFTPMQPTSEPPRFGQYLFTPGNNNQQNSSSMGNSSATTAMNGQEYGSLRGGGSSNNLNPSSSSLGPNHDRDVKAKRRESSLLMVDQKSMSAMSARMSSQMASTGGIAEE
ncbi:MAG: isocitrate dehydrogenase (NAD(+)) idh1 [Watsoniomyces obsoletus]|nr:MAG: isocitrate dehydrogenase (NAD(+)) idh1 [Watsoniomyces obsoletus]